MAATIWARAEPDQNHLLPTACSKSCLFCDFPLYLKNTLKYENPTHIRLEILYNNINTPLRVLFHRINTLSFVFPLFNENEIYIKKIPFTELEILSNIIHNLIESDLSQS